MKLDRTKSFGEIIGSTDGSKYVQGGKLYDCQGNILGSGSNPEVISVKTEERPKLGLPPKHF